MLRAKEWGNNYTKLAREIALKTLYVYTLSMAANNIITSNSIASAQLHAALCSRSNQNRGSSNFFFSELFKKRCLKIESQYVAYGSENIETLNSK